jgi:pentatricopeptide repeat protein
LEAKATYDGLSPKVRHSKTVQLMYIVVAQNLDESVYETALERFQADFPDAPNTYIMMMDFYVLKKNYEKALQEVNKLDSMVRDPFLNFYRGNYLKHLGRSKEGIDCYEKFYQLDPAFAPNTRNLIGSYAEAGRMDDAKKVIVEFKQQKGFKPQYLDEVYSIYPSLKD